MRRFLFQRRSASRARVHNYLDSTKKMDLVEGVRCRRARGPAAYPRDQDALRRRRSTSSGSTSRARVRFHLEWPQAKAGRPGKVEVLITGPDRMRRPDAMRRPPSSVLPHEALTSVAGGGPRGPGLETITSRSTRADRRGEATRALALTVGGRRDDARLARFLAGYPYGCGVEQPMSRFCPTRGIDGLRKLGVEDPSSAPSSRR